MGRVTGLRGLAGKVVVIAGGASGIGTETARRLGREGWLVVVGDVAADAALQVAEINGQVIKVDGGTILR